jgi:AcrR family transcriptional regulator
MPRDSRNTKVHQLLITAQDLFMRHGIRRITIEEICSEAKISKMTFYKYFENKIELIKHLLNQIFSEQMDEYRDIMKKDIAYTEKVKHMIQAKDERTKMLSQEFINDLYKNPIPEVAELIEKLKVDAIGEVLRDLQIASENGDIRQNIKPELILYFLNHMREMVKEGKLSHIYSSPNELIMELTNFFFYGVLPAGNDEK